MVLLGADGRSPLADERPVYPADGSVLRLLEGAWPTGARDLALDPSTALIIDAGPGDVVRVLGSDGVAAAWQLTGLVDPRLGSSGVAVTDAGMQALLGPGFERVLLAGSPAENADRVAAAGLADDTVITDVSADAAGRQDDAAAGLGALGALLSSLTLVTAVAGAFVISNTFQVSAASRRREAALLRAIGASSRQVGRQFLIEALLLGSLAAGMGLLLGAAAGVAASTLVGFPVAPSAPVMGLGWAMGLVLTVVGVRGPVRAVASVPPVAALGTADLTEVEPVSGVRWALAAPLLAFSVLVVQIPLVGAVIGGLLVFITLVLLGPVLVPRIGSFVMAGPLRRGPVARIARANVVRYPRRAARTTTAVLMGIALVASVTALLSAAGNVSQLHEDRELLVLAPTVTDEMVAQATTLDGVIDAWSRGGSGLVLLISDEATATAGAAALVDGWPGAHLAEPGALAGASEHLYNWIATSLAVVAVMSLVVGLIGVLNTVRLTALERRREFAVLRAVGMTTGQLTRMVVAEATGLTGIGAVLGLLLGAATIYGMLGAASVVLLPLVSWWLIGLVCLAVVGAAGLGATLPARRAARVAPATAVARATG